jgi:hypothetical protein
MGIAKNSDNVGKNSVMVGKIPPWKWDMVGKIPT